MHTAYCTVYNEYSILHTIDYTVYTAHCILHTINCSKPTTVIVIKTNPPTAVDMFSVGSVVVPTVHQAVYHVK